MLPIKIVFLKPIQSLSLIMKKLLFALLTLVSCLGFSQNNYIVKTEDGRRVLLKADYTWEYIDRQPTIEEELAEANKVSKANACSISTDHEEPKIDKKIEAQLKRGRATLYHVKKKVAKDYGCTVDDVILLSIFETPRVSKYTFCANGEKVYYKRNGHKVLEKGQLF
jgi:hypothetical protein